MNKDQKKAALSAFKSNENITLLFVSKDGYPFTNKNRAIGHCVETKGLKSSDVIEVERSLFADELGDTAKAAEEAEAKAAEESAALLEAAEEAASTKTTTKKTSSK